MSRPIALIAYAAFFTTGLCGKSKPHAFPVCNSLVLKKAPHIKPGKNIVSLVADKQSTQYIIKQLDSDPARYITKTAIEALGAFIAESIGILTNRVAIIAADEVCQYKFFPNQPATIHQFVSGPGLHQLHLFNKINIRQKKVRNGPVPRPGITALTIKSMTEHSDMPPIAALDTFLGNDDRHASNLIYDKAANRFYAIDFTVAFYVNLAKHSIQNLQQLKEEQVSFSRAEKRALRYYKNTLKRLVELHSPESLCAQYDDLLEQIGYSRILPSFSDREKELINERILERKKYIEENYRSSLELIALLDQGV